MSDTPKKYTNPYEGLEVTVRIQSNINPDDYNFIRSIRPNSGTVITTVNILWHKLVTTLKQHGITQYSDLARFEHFVNNCELTVPTLKPTDGGTTEPSGRTTRRASKKTA